LKKNGADFCWNKKCEIFPRTEEVPSLTALSKPSSGETLFLYLAISELAVSGALVWKDEGIQKPVITPATP